MNAVLLSAGSDTAVTTMSGLLGTVTSVLTSAISWMSSIGSAIVGNPLLLLGCVLAFVGFGVGLFKRLLHV